MDNVRMGIIGYGNMGSAHATCIGEGRIAGMSLAAACDTAPGRLAAARARYPDLPLYDNHAALLESGAVDAVLVATPHYDHPPIVCDALAAGLHVLSEKPAGVYTRQVRQMNAAAARSGRVFGIMFNQRTNPLFVKAREIVQSGSLGVFKRMVWVVTNWYRTQAYYDSGGWRGSWGGEGGGVLINQAPHNLDLWQWICGMPATIQAFCKEGLYHNIEVEDDATIYAGYPSGASAVFITSTGEYPGTNRLEISGDRGRLVLEGGVLRHTALAVPERELCFSGGGMSPGMEQTVSEFAQNEAEPGHAGILQNFTDAVLKGTPLLAPGEEGLCELSISNAAYLSSWSGRPVSLPLTAESEALMEAELQARSAPAGNDASDSAAAARQSDGYSDRWQVRW